MVSALSKLLPWSRARRWEKLAYDPTRAPHRPLVDDLVRGQLSPMTRQLREDNIEDLLTRILWLETTAVPLVEESRPAQLQLLISRARQVVEQIETEQKVLRRKFARFSTTYSRIEDPEEQQGLIAEYLINTATDDHALKGDLKAVNRYLGYDVLRERQATELAAHSITIEVAVEFIGRAGRACLGHEDEDHRPDLEAFLQHTEADRFLGTRLEKGDRWQLRLAAGEALLQILGTGGEAGQLTMTGSRAADAEDEGDGNHPDGTEDDDTDLPSARPSADRPREIFGSIDRCVHNVEEHAWVQAKALELLMVIDPSHARQVIEERLFGQHPDELPNDFLFRRLAIVLAGRYSQKLKGFGAYYLFERMLGRPDPSEHVRMGVCEAITYLPAAGAVNALASVLGTGGAVNESSARVRASAVIALTEVAKKSDIDRAEAENIAQAFVDVMAGESDPLVLEIAIEELIEVATALEGREPGLLPTWMPIWQRALSRILAGEETGPAVANVAALALEELERRRVSEREALIRYLGERVSAIRPGKHGFIRWDEFPDKLAVKAREALFLGRCLASMSQDDWGLSARIRPRGLHLWRGDVFRFRMWRLLHEIRNPAPNKRQGHVHSWGRVPHGDIRAHPAHLDEVTATTVPGERTQVDEAGGWGRYLPLVDDILDLPLWRRRAVRLFSNHGVTTLAPPRSLLKRLWNRLRITWRYRDLAAARLAALASSEPGERHRYVKTLTDRLGVAVEFTPYDREPTDGESEESATSDTESRGEPAANPRILSLFRARAGAAVGEAQMVAAIPLVDELQDWFSQNGPYFLSLTQNSQAALAIFLTLFFSYFVIWSHVRRRRLARARSGIPLSIGGWGTRGKSGTERLKAGLFHGLGYHVLAKTTGCEAMFINAAPGQQATEIFLYRAYDKASIWEQADVLGLAQGVKADVFLWECMALNPRYVEILSHDWMQDHLVTLTNAYPDHEDIQGPAGSDVARVISRFIPKNRILVTSEVNFLPLFAQVCRDNNTELNVVRPRDGDLIAADVLALFPYSEHPRNIALVARMAEKLGLDRDLAIVTMAENVVPDLGVLKTYGPACVRGRSLSFINGCSANERTGFLNNWRRLALDRLDADEDPQTQIITVVNNRADRISRSVVFADILVADVAVDRHVLIGTNLKGLRSYLNTSLDRYLDGRMIVQEEDFAEADPRALPMSRLGREMRRFRIASPSRQAVMDRLAIYAAGAGLAVVSENKEVSGEPYRDKRASLAELEGRIDELLAPEGDESILLEQVIKRLDSDAAFKTLVGRVLIDPGSDPKPEGWSETLEPAERSDVVTHFIEAFARILVRARLEARLRRLIASKSSEAIGKFHGDFQAAYRALFDRQVIIVHDPNTTGDRIIEICAAATPPGTRVGLLGTQNIKGTGLDFVYRWIAIDKVLTSLGKLDSTRAEQRIAALSELDAFGDYGLFGAGLARSVLSEHRFTALSPQEASLQERVLQKVDGIFKAKRSQLRSAGGKSRLHVVAGWLEGWIDYLDSIRRRRKSKSLMRDVTAQRISLDRAAIEMRAVVSRQKGGWLAKSLSRKA